MPMQPISKRPPLHKHNHTFLAGTAILSQDGINIMQPISISKRSPLRTMTSSRQVRSKFFHRIGIPMPPPNNKTLSVSVAERSVRDLRNVPRFNEPLSNPQHYQEREEGGPSSSPQMEEKRRVGFQETVTVVPIPMRNEYSDRIRSKLWRGNVERSEMQKRNIIEFASEDYDWRNARHEEEMYLCGDTKELIHPIHVELGRYTFGTGGSCKKTDYGSYNYKSPHQNTIRRYR